MRRTTAAAVTGVLLVTGLIVSSATAGGTVTAPDPAAQIRVKLDQIDAQVVEVHAHTARIDVLADEIRALLDVPAPPPRVEPPPVPVPAPGTTLFAAAFDDGGIGEWDAIQTTPTAHDETPQPVAGRLDLVARDSGGTALRVRRPAGDRERPELLPGPVCNVVAGDIRTITVDWMFPMTFPTPQGRWFIVFQQHAGQTLGGPPAFAIEVDRFDRLVVRNNRLNDAPTPIGPIDRGRWHRYEITVKFAASDGWVEVRRDGVMVVPRTRRVTWPASYSKIGIYSDHTAHEVTSELFIDNFRFSRP